jgi:hypothetical protein
MVKHDAFSGKPVEVRRLDAGVAEGTQESQLAALRASHNANGPPNEAARPLLASPPASISRTHTAAQRAQRPTPL